ncbi:hypothetical protein BUZ54_11045 [Staphylococcus hominis]|nr:hypothetical protein BUZ54_11045 [Staphylococcus hominis]
MPRKFLFGMSDMLLSWYFVGINPNKPPTNSLTLLANTLLIPNNKEIGIMQQDFELEFVRGNFIPNFLIYFYKSFLKPF